MHVIPILSDECITSLATIEHLLTTSPWFLGFQSSVNDVSCDITVDFPSIVAAPPTFTDSDIMQLGREVAELEVISQT